MSLIQEKTSFIGLPPGKAESENYSELWEQENRIFKTNEDKVQFQII